MVLDKSLPSCGRGCGCGCGRGSARMTAEMAMMMSEMGCIADCLIGDPREMIWSKYAGNSSD